MFAVLKNKVTDVTDRTVYLEIFSDRKVAYRVTAGRTVRHGKESNTYGIEAVDSRTGETERIADFSPDIEDAVAFAEMLTAERAKPRQLYSRALNFLYLLI
ncbi:MAG: hypothetical protein IJ779_07760 [Ruminococcus sp.]|nr:hypothetical protein [Ruminococcus sp.]